MRRNFFSEDFVRVISGQARGLKLSSPAGTDTRPTLDRVKEAIFSMLMPYLSNATVLDLFAGSGALGIEALSRGAAKAYFIDNSNAAVSCVKKNLSAAKMIDKSIVNSVDYLKFLNSCSEKFDIIFIDPPYAKNLYNSVFESILRNSLLNENGIIVAEWDYEIGFPENLGGLDIVKEKKYGRVGITVLKRSL